MRGVLTAHHLTVSRLVAVLAAMVVLVGVIVLGVVMRWTGPVISAVAVTCALMAELCVLSMAWSKAKVQRQAFAPG